jgi:hypothetical protein
MQFPQWAHLPPQELKRREALLRRQQVLGQKERALQVGCVFLLLPFGRQARWAGCGYAALLWQPQCGLGRKTRATALEGLAESMPGLRFVLCNCGRKRPPLHPGGPPYQRIVGMLEPSLGSTPERLRHSCQRSFRGSRCRRGATSAGICWCRGVYNLLEGLNQHAHLFGGAGGALQARQSFGVPEDFITDS